MKKLEEGRGRGARILRKREMVNIAREKKGGIE
jgi:hypothetical protein